MKNFWQDLPKPFFVLAPMDDVTDSVFRQIVASAGKPDVFFTEFTNTDAMCSIGRVRVEKKLQFTENEQPLIAQIWGTNPEHFAETTKIIRAMGFTGIDINMGCPEKSIVKRGSCAGLIKNPSLAGQIIRAVQKEAGEMPVSVKTRVGFNQIQTEEWISFLLEYNLDALTIHARTAKEESKVPAHWEEVGKVVSLRNKMKKQTIIIGNGDIMTISEAKEKVNQYGVDGIMIGRGIFKNLWLFNKEIRENEVTSQMRINKLIEHATLYDITWKGTKPFPPLKKFVKAYVNGFPAANELRLKLMESKSSSEMLELAKDFLQTIYK